MKVLLINNRAPYCGIGNYAFSLYNALKRMLGDEVELLSWRGELIERLYLEVRDSQPLQYPEEALRLLSQLVFMLKVPRRYHLYHITNSSFSPLAKKVKPCVVTVHDLIPFTSPRDLTDSLIRRSVRALKHADRIICVSQNTKHDLFRFLDLDQDLVRVIHEGVDHNLYKPRDKMASRKILDLDQDKLIVLHVSSEEPRKNIPTLMKAFHKLKRRIPEAILVRVGEKTREVQRLIKSLGLGDKVLYFRIVKNLHYFYDAADLLVFPSYEEGFGFPPLQAMASGCPVIASNTTSIPEVIGDAGILVNPSDVNGFAHWMHKVYTNHELKSKLIRKGLERSQIFSWEKCAKETLETYRTIVE